MVFQVEEEEEEVSGAGETLQGPPPSSGRHLGVSDCGRHPTAMIGKEEIRSMHLYLYAKVHVNSFMNREVD